MELLRNVFALPDEVLAALNHYLSINCTVTTVTTIQSSVESRFYPINGNDSDTQLPMHCSSSDSEEGLTYRSSLNGPSSRQNAPSGIQRGVSPCCSKNKDNNVSNPSKCPNDSPFHQERPPGHLCQDQAVRQQLIQHNRNCSHQTPLNQSEQFQQRSQRSQSVPRGNVSERYVDSEQFEGHRAQHERQESMNASRGCCAHRTLFEDNPSARNSCSSNRKCAPDRSSRRDAPCWEIDEWQRRQMQFQQQMRQQHVQQRQLQQQQLQRQRQIQSRQQQANRSDTATFLEDNEISGFEPDFNSTMIEKDDRSLPSTKSRNKTGNSGNQQAQRMCRTSDEMPRRQQQRGQSQCGHRQSQQYETVLNQTSYMPLPEVLREAQGRPNKDKNQCHNSQSLYQDISPINCSNFRSRGGKPRELDKTDIYPEDKNCCRSPMCRSLSPINCGNNTNMDMDETDVYPEETNCCRSPKYMEMSRAILERLRRHETSLAQTNQNSCCTGRSTRTYDKTPEETLAERTQAEFMDALVKDRTCPGAIQSSLNGNENFNEFAYDIAFAGPIPAKPFPVDPITMLEAVKLRIDYERDELRKRHQKELTMGDIQSFFKEKNKSEVNDGVAAFLKAENEYTLSSRKTDSFDAQINSHETNMFDDSIKINVYTAKTQPGN